MSNLLTFSELLVTKFCHDVSGAIGAINNGFEFLEIENSEEMHKKAMALIKSSSLEASAKLKFYRYIFGRNQSEGEVDLEEIKRLFNEFFAFNKIKLVFVHQSSGPNLVQLSSKTCRLVANLAFLASTSLLQGGEIKIELAQDSVTKKAKIIASGDKMKVAKEIISILENHELVEINLSNVHIHFAAKVATDLGCVVKSTTTANSFELAVELS